MSEMENNNERPTILVVDDDELNLRLVSIFLESYGYYIHKAENGNEALEKLGIKKTDLVVTDFSMPNMNGLTLAGKIKGKIPIIVISGALNKEERIAFEKEGVEVFLGKPINKDLLCEKVQKILDKKKKQLRI